MSDNRSQECVFEEGEDRSAAELGLNHGVVDLRLVEELLQLIVGILPSDVEVTLTVNINGWPVTVLCTHGDDGIIDNGNRSIFCSHSIEWRKVRVDRGVHDLVLTGLVRPNQVDSVVVINDHVWVPDLVESWIGDLRRINQGFTTWREHGIVQVLRVPCPDDVNVSFAV